MQSTNKPNNTPKKGKNLKEKVRKHINDKNDKITEEDLRDVIVGTQAVNTANPDEPSITVNDIPEKSIVTPWDVLNNDTKKEPS